MPVKKTATKKKVEKKTKQETEALKFLDDLKKKGMMGDIRKKIDFISTGSWVVNRLIGDGQNTGEPGGLPKGYVTELYGNEGCGKTTLALHAAKQCQDAGGCVVFADFEHSLRAQLRYVQSIGVDVDDPMKFVHLEPTNFEDGVKVIGEALIKLKPDLIIIDSATAMLPKSAFEADADESVQIGKHAKMMGTFLNWITKKLGTYDCACLLLNQLRSVIKASKYDAGPNEITSGGKAVRFFPVLRIELKATSKKEEVTETSNITGVSEKKIVNQEVKAIVRKNKIDAPYKTGPIYITFGEGVDNILSLISLAEGKKVLKKGSGGWYEWNDPKGEYSFKLQGKQKVKAYLEENPDVLSELKLYLNPTQDSGVIAEKKEALQAAEEAGNELSAEEQAELAELEGLNFEDGGFEEDGNFEED